VDLDVSPTLPNWTGEGWNLWDVTADQLYQQYFVQFSYFVERFKEAQINVTIENYRNAPFAVDPKISLRGDDILSSVQRSENVSLIASTNVPALGSINLTFRFTPHRMWLQELAVFMVVNNPTDTWTDNNDATGGLMGVAGYYDGAETVRADTVANGFTRVNNPAEARAGNWYWFTGSSTTRSKCPGSTPGSSTGRTASARPSSSTTACTCRSTTAATWAAGTASPSSAATRAP
jgi:hypothetical protein